MPSRSKLGALLYVGDVAKTRIRHLLARVMGAAVSRGYDGDRTLFEMANWVLSQAGVDLRGANVLTLDDAFEERGAAIPGGTALSFLLAAAWHCVGNQLDKLGRHELMAPEEYARELNAILAEEHAKFRLRDGTWVATSASDVELLCRVLLANTDEAVACRQGDVQVEMVASTVQAKLGSPSAVIVDYGAGVGRVLAGLASAQNFKTAHYIAVDEPMPPEVRKLAGRTGAKTSFVDSRAKFLASNTVADVIMVVNTLHHVPFKDVAHQLGALLAKLKTGGILLVHEMGALRDPEQRNVPWRVEDLIKLFEGEEFEANARSTSSKSGVPLAHVLVTTTGKGAPRAALDRNVPVIWRQMKDRALGDIRALYAARDPDRHDELQHALITNANLDLNQPPGLK